MKKLVFSVALLMSISTSSAYAQSEAVSRVSLLSMAPSVEIGSLALHTLREGGKFSVKSIQHVGEAVEIVVESAINGAQFVIRGTGKLIRETAIVTGATVSTVAVSAGLMVYVIGEAIAFIADELTRDHTYSRQHS